MKLAVTDSETSIDIGLRTEPWDRPVAKEEANPAEEMEKEQLVRWKEPQELPKPSGKTGVPSLVLERGGHGPTALVECWD